LRLSRIKLQIFPIVGFLLLAALCLAPTGARAANFTASLDRDTITLGETATLSLTFEGGQSKNVPTPNISGPARPKVSTSSTAQ
jgi:hypothetical protein